MHGAWMRAVAILLMCFAGTIQGQREHKLLCASNRPGLRLFTVPETGCKRFALCQGTTYYGTLQCPGHTEFDEARQVCNHPWVVDCPGNVPVYQDCLHGVNPWNCSLFHLCYLGRQFDFSCNPPLLYSSTHLVCVWPWDLSPIDKSKCEAQ